MWDVFVRRWLDLAFWWLPRKREAPPEKTQPTATRPAEPSVREAARPTEAPRPTDAAAPAPSQPASPPSAPAAAQPEKAVAPPVPDDLTVIKGIGPAVQNKLRALGITTFADLASADPDALLEQLKGSQPLTRARVHDWTEGARQRVRS